MRRVIGQKTLVVLPRAILVRDAGLRAETPLLVLVDATADQAPGARSPDGIDGTGVPIVTGVVAAAARDAERDNTRAKQPDRQGTEGAIHAVQRISETVPPLKVRR